MCHDLGRDLSNRRNLVKKTTSSFEELNNHSEGYLDAPSQPEFDEHNLSPKGAEETTKKLNPVEKMQRDIQNLSDSEIIRRRHFNNSEREALYIAAGGLCSLCGCLLDGLWEPDHIIPFHEGGLTDVANGQATCRPCNRAKGGRYV